MTQEIIFSQVPFEQLTDVLAEKVLARISPVITSAARQQPQDEFLTRTQAANVLGVSLVTLSKWTKDGLIKGHRIASRVRYKRNELETSLSHIKTR